VRGLWRWLVSRLWTQGGWCSWMSWVSIRQ
jgi:hypothetical protein